MDIKRSTLYSRAKDNLNKKMKEADIIKDKIATISCIHRHRRPLLEVHIYTDSIDS